jgi:hypothetical protein
VKCYWVDKDQNIEDFMFRLTPNQPIYFSAMYGAGDWDVTVPPFYGVGELKCWAVNAAGDQQISFNHLYGTAAIVSAGFNGIDEWVMYNAWSFTARLPFGATVGTGGYLALTGAAGGYDACPQYLVSNFYPDLGPDLTLVPCKQDLRQDRIPTCTKAKFDIWNENETKFTGAYQCLKCWYEGFLDEISPPSGFGGEKFTWWALKTSVARFRVQSANNAACRAAFPECVANPAANVLTPFVGVLLYAERWAIDGLEGFVPFAGTTPFGAGADGTGYVAWDPQYLPQETPGK